MPPLGISGGIWGGQCPPQVSFIGRLCMQKKLEDFLREGVSPPAWVTLLEPGGRGEGGEGPKSHMLSDLYGGRRIF